MRVRHFDDAVVPDTTTDASNGRGLRNDAIVLHPQADCRDDPAIAATPADAVMYSCKAQRAPAGGQVSDVGQRCEEEYAAGILLRDNAAC